jgi:3-phosphoshikimate 1-carboxyvinyltransferase
MVPFREPLRLSQSPCFRGRFVLPGDKSLCHRLAILGSLASGRSRLSNFTFSADCRSTLDCLVRLGVRVTGHKDGGLSIEGRGWQRLAAPSEPLDAGNSGSTLRMLAGVLAGRPFTSVLTGDDALRRRPMERVAAPLRAMGAGVSTTEGRPPVTIEGHPLTGITWTLEVPSAQVKTALLLAGLQAEGTTTVVEPEPSRDHTERLLPLFGVEPERSGSSVTIRRHDRLRPVEWEMPGDVSSAAFFVVAALVIPDSQVRVDHVLLNPRRTGFLDVLREMGAEVESGIERESPEPTGWIEARSSRLRGTTIPASLVPSLIDEIPALAVAGAHAEGTLTVTGAQELRVKESDRIAALAEGLVRLGADVTELQDGLAIRGGRPLCGAQVRSHGDHRIAMALAVAALSASGETEIEGSDCVSVSFPGFFRLLEMATRA